MEELTLQPTTEPEYVDDRVLIARFSLSRSFWQELRARGKGPPYYKVGGKRILYKLHEVQQWMEAQRTEPKAAGPLPSRHPRKTKRAS